VASRRVSHALVSPCGERCLVRSSLASVVLCGPVSHVGESSLARCASDQWKNTYSSTWLLADPVVFETVIRKSAAVVPVFATISGTSSAVAST